MLIRFDDFEVDTDRFELRRSGTVRPVEPLVFDLIRFLAQNPERVVGRDEIVDHVWKGRIVSDATISGCIKSARKALGDSGDAQAYIRTVRGRGFRFVADVACDAGAEEAESTSHRTSARHDAPNPGPSSVKPAELQPQIPDKPILAVLPFKNLSADVDGYFADGLTEDIITNLSRFRELMIIGRSSTFRFKDQPVSVPEMCSRLGANYGVEGSVRRAAGRVRVTAQLVDPGSGVHLWAEHYDRDLEDIFAVQDEVTRMIAATLGVKIQDVATQRAMRKSAAALDAYDCVLRARRYTSMLSEEMHAEARDLLEQAVIQDPTYADAHALLANVYLAEHRFDANPRPDPIGRALQMAETATRLDPQNAYARGWLGIVHFFRHENDKFEAEAQRALALNPNDPELLADIGHYFAFMGQFERGLELSMRARQLNPLHPGWYFFTSARFHYDRGEYREMLADIERVGMPHFYWTHMLTAAAQGQLGREKDAAASLATAFRLKPDFSARAELTKWNAASGDLDHLMDGLRKAGLRE